LKAVRSSTIAGTLVSLRSPNLISGTMTIGLSASAPSGLILPISFSLSCSAKALWIRASSRSSKKTTITKMTTMTTNLYFWRSSETLLEISRRNWLR